MKRLRIGYITTKDPKDRVIWSGAIHFMYTALGKYAGDVEHVGAPLPIPIRLLWHWINSTRRLFGQRLGIMQSIPLSMVYGLHYSRKIREGNYDVILAPVAAAETAYLKTSVPVCYLSDTIFKALENYYFRTDEITALSRWQADYLDRRAQQHAAAIIYTNDWARQCAIRDCGADPDKIHVVPFGANFVNEPSRESLGQGSTDGVCRLLFVSADWNRKRGQLAYEAMLALRAMGINAEFTVIGCTPTPPLEHPNLHVVRFLNKNIPEELQRLEQYYRDADFFILPTRAECSANVFCEASAYGLPSVATDTGGISTPVKEGINGFLLPPEAGPDAYAAIIADLWRDPARYQQLRRTTRERYEALLNWKSWAESVREVMLGVIQAKHPSA